MDKFRNMEVVLMLMFAALCTGAVVIEPSAKPRGVRDFRDGPTAAELVPSATVIIVGKRMTPAQKQAAIAAEAAAAGRG